MARPKGSKDKKPRSPICKNGHNKDIVGRDKGGHCIVCQKGHLKKWNDANKDSVKERRKHYREENKEYIRDWKKRHYIENKERILQEMKEYYEANKEKILARNKEWANEHQQLILSHKIKCQTNRNLRIVVWTDWEEVEKIYEKRPADKVVDHYIPLQGKLISGLHVSWNLQYMYPKDNTAKHNHVDLLEVSKWYGEILKRAGLK